MNLQDNRTVRFVYQNHRDEVAVRTVTPIRLEFRKSDWHNTAQWLLIAYDHERLGERDFALAGILKFLSSPPE